MSGFRNKVLIRRRVWRGEPGLEILLHLIIYKIPSVFTTKGGKDNKRFILFDAWRTAPMPSSQLYNTNFGRDTYSDSVRCHLWVPPFHLMEQVIRQLSTRNHENMAHLQLPPSYHPQYHGRHPRSGLQPTVLRPSLTDPISRVQPVSCLSPTTSSQISL